MFTWGKHTELNLHIASLFLTKNYFANPASISQRLSLIQLPFKQRSFHQSGFHLIINVLFINLASI